MKIIFLCGSLETGQDGVGDYTRRMAGELIRQGHETAVIAINDKYITETYQGIQKDDSQQIIVLRLSALEPWKLRIEKAKIWIDDFNPEWLSLQYVPFAFHLKGLHYGLTSKLYWLGLGRRWHIMFHELWVGMYSTSSMKEICWGLFQQYLILRLIKKLKPDLIHTQTRVYQAQLMRLSFKTQLLPLFGNIPKNDPSNNRLHMDELSSKCIRFVVFGVIHPKAPIEQFANEVAEFSRKHSVSFSLTFIGRSSLEEKKRWTDVWKSSGLEIIVLGEQSPEVISEVLTNASFGISSTPIAIAEKSGAIASMLEHHLPVICVAVPWHERRGINFEPPSGVAEYRKGNFKELIENLKCTKRLNHVESIVLNFITSLKANKASFRLEFSTSP